MRNKALKKEKTKQGKEVYGNSIYNFTIDKDPLAFANSDRLNKIKNRNKKHK